MDPEEELEQVTEENEQLREQLVETHRDLETMRARLDELELLEHQTTDRAQTLGHQQRALERQQELLGNREGLLDDRAREFDTRQQRLDARARELDALQLRADGGFTNRRVELELALQGLRQELLARQQELQAERADHARQLTTQAEEQLRNFHDAFAEDLRQHQDHVRKVSQQAQTQTQTLHEQLRADAEGEIARRMARLEAERQKFDTRHADLLQREQAVVDRDTELERERIDIGQERRRLEARDEQLGVQWSRLDEIVAERWADQIDTHVDDQTRRQAHIEQLRRERGQLQTRLLAFEDLRHGLGDREPEDVLADLHTLREEVELLRDRLANMPGPAELEALRGESRRREEAEHALIERERELTEAQVEVQRLWQSQADVEHARAQVEQLERLRDALRAQNEALDEELRRLRGIFERPIERANRIGVIETPQFTRDEIPARDDNPLDEAAWLGRIERLCCESELRFPRRLLESFHTSLKTAEWSPLTVLAGVSGTGKSALPQLYSRFGGIPFLSLPVEPNWDSPQSLFGFFNSVDNQYNATPLLQAMVQAQCEYTEEHPEGLRDAMLLVLLDEMNLAHVELYFSELLSRLEERRGNPRVFTNVNLGAGVDGYPLELGRNVLWTGTMNEDETTTSLSDKVLDRGNILHFPRPTEFVRRRNTTLAHPVELLPRATWEKWCTPVRSFTDEEIAPFKGLLEEFNQHLGTAGRALGHRVWQSIEHYMGNHPGVRQNLTHTQERPESTERRTEASDVEETIETQGSMTSALREAMTRAFEDQLVLKVMPKLRGIDTMGDSRTRCLDPIAKLLDDSSLGLHLQDDFENAVSAGHGVFVWHSTQYLEQT